MKKVTIVLIVAVLMLTSTALGVVYNQQITALLTNSKVVVNGNYVNSASAPIIYNGSLYLSANDISKYTTTNVVWVENSNTVYLFNKLVQNNVITNPNPTNISVNNGDLNNYGPTLESSYGSYVHGSYELEFNYDVKNYVNYVKVKGLGQNFDKTSNKWKKKGESDFRYFMNKMLYQVSTAYKKDSKVYLYDDDNDEVAQYEYTYNTGKFEVVSEAEDFSSTNDAEDTLEDKYEVFEGDGGDLEFEYQVSKYSSYIKVTMTGDFDNNDDEWDERGKTDFRDFVEEFTEKISDGLNEDVKVYVKDENNYTVARYEYDESKDEFSREYEYEK